METPQPKPTLWDALLAANRRIRLRQLIDEAGSQRELADRIGKAPAQISQWMNQSPNQDGKPRQISARSARDIEAALGLPAGWMDQPADDDPGPGPDESPPVRASDLHGLAPRVSRHETRGDHVLIPLYAAEVSAGAGGHMDDAEPEVVRDLQIARWWAERHLPRDLNRVRVLTARGDSMSPDIADGDLLFVDTGRAVIDGPGVYVLNWHGRALVKRLVPELRTGRLAIVSSNPAYPTEYAEPGEIDQLHVGGRVSAAWALRRF